MRSLADGGDGRDSENKDSEVVLRLVRAGLCSTLESLLVGRWSGGAAFAQHRSDACDILVLVLANDGAMRHLFAEGEGKWIEVRRRSKRTCSQIQYYLQICGRILYRVSQNRQESFEQFPNVVCLLYPPAFLL